MLITLLDIIHISVCLFLMLVVLLQQGKGGGMGAALGGGATQQVFGGRVGDAESIRDLDLGIGPIINFGPSRHQGSHKVWGTVLEQIAEPAGSRSGWAVRACDAAARQIFPKSGTMLLAF